MLDMSGNLSLDALTVGTTGRIWIEKDQIELYSQNILSVESAQIFIKNYGKSIPEASFLKTILIPIRTNSWKNFAKDLFLPIFINNAVKTDSLALKIFVSLWFIAIDVASFIPRLVLAPFRVVFNWTPEKEHPLVGLIKGKPEAQEALKSGVVTIRIELKEIKDIRKTEAEISEDRPKARVFTVKGYAKVAFMQLPTAEYRSEFDYTRKKYRATNTEWILEKSDSSEQIYKGIGFPLKPYFSSTGYFKSSTNYKGIKIPQSNNN